ncbi:MAG: ribosome small subunit-dependent GTPase A [Clostridia bacterium]
MTGTIIRGMGGLYYVRGDDDSVCYVLRARGRLRHEHATPLVGDRVDFAPGEGEIHGWLEQIHPRVTECIRPPVANVERLLLVIAPTPAPDLLLIDRLLVRAQQTGMDAVLCVNKCDMDDSLVEKIRQEYAILPVLAVSAQRGDGMEQLRAQMMGKLCCFAGQSGVGKSTLLSALLGIELKTGEMSQKIARGKHTTRHTELLEGASLRVLDTPGFSLLALETGMDPIALQDYYPEMQTLTALCRFQPCLHDQEPGCAVREAASCGKIAPERLARYQILLAEARQSWRERYD